MVTNSLTRSGLEILKNDLAEIVWRWDQWRAIFVGDGARQQLLSRTAPAFFGLLNELLLDDVLLRLSKLGDENSDALHLKRLAKEARHRVGPERASRAEDLVRRYNEATQPIRRHRHDRIAHKNYNSALGMAPLPSIEFSRIERAADLAEKLLRLLDPNDGEFMYRDMIANGDARALLRLLEGTCR